MLTKHTVAFPSVIQSATQGTFSWLRSTGYPANEKPLYQHSWTLRALMAKTKIIPNSILLKGPPLTFVDDWLESVIYWWSSALLSQWIFHVEARRLRYIGSDERNNINQRLYCIQKAIPEHMYWYKHIEHHVKRYKKVNHKPHNHQAGVSSISISRHCLSRFVSHHWRIKPHLHVAGKVVNIGATAVLPVRAL